MLHFSLSTCRGTLRPRDRDILSREEGRRTLSDSTLNLDRRSNRLPENIHPPQPAQEPVRIRDAWGRHHHPAIRNASQARTWLWHANRGRFRQAAPSPVGNDHPPRLSGRWRSAWQDALVLRSSLLRSWKLESLRACAGEQVLDRPRGLSGAGADEARAYGARPSILIPPSTTMNP
jgi:hypothetical protein